jgi:hypothetical protein
LPVWIYAMPIMGRHYRILYIKLRQPATAYEPGTRTASAPRTAAGTRRRGRGARSQPRCRCQSGPPATGHRTQRPCRAGSSRKSGLGLRGDLLSFLGGVLVGHPRVRKCHQMSSKEHIQLGWVVRWVLSTPPARATPRLGGVYVSCQYFPCSFVLALRELGLRLGVKAQLRASSRGVLPGAPNALSV